MGTSFIRSVSDVEFPANGTPQQKLAHASKYARFAPAESNWQPWEFRLTDTHLELIARNEPGRDALDPEGREPMISCGAALLYLRLALKHFGCLGRVELFPELDQPTLAAKIYCGFGRERDAHEKSLFAAMTARRATTPTWGATPVSETVLAALNRAVVGERGWLEFAHSETSRQRLLEFAVISERPRMVPAPSPDRAGFPVGPPVDGPGWPTARWTRPFFTFRVRRTDTGNVAAHPETLPTLPVATLAVVKTKTDDKHGWLAAGQAMAQVILQAQALGLAWSFFNQAVRQRVAREALRTGIGHKGFAQVILRFDSVATAATSQPTTTMTASTTLR